MDLVRAVDDFAFDSPAVPDGQVQDCIYVVHMKAEV